MKIIKEWDNPLFYKHNEGVGENGI
jgi:hypothetical protein